MQLRLPWAPRPRRSTELLLKDIPAFGSSTTQKEDYSFRVGLQNIHGLITSSSELIGTEEVGGIEKLGIDLMGLVELNVNCTLDVKSSFMTAANLKLAPARTVMSSNWSLDEGYMPGGTAMVLNGSACGRMHNKGSDKLGRFTWMALRGRNGVGVIVITVYRVCQKAGSNVGDDTAYMQQYVAMREAGIKRPDPKNMVLDDITDILLEWGQKGYRPLVLMDANSKTDETHLQEFMERHGLIDLIADSNAGIPPSTYARGPNRIDLILGDQYARRAVVKSGALALHGGVTSSDHTMQFVDFDERLLFKDDSFTPVAGLKREFRLYDVRKKQKFQSKLLTIYEHQKIPERVASLAERFSQSQITPELIQEYERLDTEIVDAIRGAAAFTGRKDFGYQRSPALCRAGLAIRLHKAIRGCVLCKVEFNDPIREMAEELEYTLPDFESLTPQMAQANVQKAVEAKRAVEANDAESRASWLEDLAAERALESGGDAEKELKRMVEAARSKGMFKRLRSILKPEWSALDYIEVPTKQWYINEDRNELFEFQDGIFLSHNSDGEEGLFDGYSTIKVPPDTVYAVEVEISVDMIRVSNIDSTEIIVWKKITKPVEIEEWLLRRNKRHLQQMYIEESPPTTKAFEHILEDYGTSAVADAILNGTYDIAELQMGPEMEYFIKGLAMTQEERDLQVPNEMSKEAFQELFKAQNEDTTSSPSGLHYTLWKAIAEVDSLAEMHAKWVSIPFKYGFIIKRWTREIDCMLEKKANVRKIHILRIIGIIEGDVSGYLKWCYNMHVMPNAEKVGISSNQWGGRKGRSAPLCALRKLVTWEYFRYVKQTMASFPGDLQSNFDRMLASMNSIISRKKGMPKLACKCRAQLVENFERPVKTAAGVSQATYKYEAGDVKLGGEVQGKPDNMQLWTMQSDILLKIHGEHCDGITMKDASNQLLSRRSADAYVDDKDTLAGAPNTNEPEEAVENLEKAAQFWVNLAGVVGQALAFHKSFWQLLSWRKVGGYYMTKPRREFENLNVCVHDHKGKSAKIKYKHINEPNEGLGVNLCPDADQRPEYRKRVKQSNAIASRVATTRFQLREAWTALTVNVVPSVTYPFGITRFTKKQLHDIAVPIHKVFLPKLGINRNTKRIALCAPLDMGGINYPCFQTIQDQKNIMLVLRQLQQGKEIATDLKILLSQAQIESGFVQPILDETSTPAPYLEPGLITHLRDRLATVEGSIVVADAWHPKLQREWDNSIMEKLTRLPGVKKRDLEHANQCRKWLRVITVAELADTSGEFIPPNRFNGQWRAKSWLNWPNQPPPEREMWDVFRRLVKRAFCKGDISAMKTHRVRLDKKLGMWLHAERHIMYDAYRTRNHIFCPLEGHGPSLYERLTQEEASNYFVVDGGAIKLPKEAHPITMLEGSEGKFHSADPYKILPIPQAAETTQQMDEEERIVKDGIDILRNSTELIACSDGSYDAISSKAAFNWRIVTLEEEGLTSVSAPIMTNPKYLNSYRAEFAGLRSLVRYLKKHGLHRKKITIYCDGKSCIDILQRGPLTGTTDDLEKAEYDIITAIFKMLEDFEDVTFEWVPGHQDDEDDTNFEDRPLAVRLNIACDLAAKECLRQQSFPSIRPQPSEGAKATLYFGNTMVTTEIKEQIQTAFQSREMNGYIMERTGWTDRQLASVNLRGLGRAKKRLELHRSIRTTKMLYDWLNLGKQKGYMKQDPRCPCCGAEGEDFLHLYHCTHANMQHAFVDAITTVKTKLVKEGVPSEIYNGYVEAMCLAAHQPHPDILYERTSDQATQVLEAQEGLGTTAILKGFHHSDWAYWLQDLWRPKPKSTNGKKQSQKDPLELSVSLIRGSWDVFEALWTARNNILHGDDSHLIEREESATISRLLQFHRESELLLSSADRTFSRYPEATILSWSRKKRLKKLQLLERLHKLHVIALQRQAARLQPITAFFEPKRGERGSDGAIGAGG